MKIKSMARFEGRLFTDAGRLCLVVEANEEAGIARVSFRADGRPHVAEMPLSEVSRRIAEGASLALDNTSGPEAAKRIVKKRDGYYFSAREGMKGPYRTSREAERDLGRHVVAAQSA